MVAKAGPRRDVTRRRRAGLLVALGTALLSPVAIIYECVVVLILTAVYFGAPKYRERLTPLLLGMVAGITPYFATFAVLALLI